MDGATRTVWDGDQIVAEVRAPENARERDTGLSSDLPLYHQAMYGRVMYVHGGGLDAPLALLRMDYDSIHREPQLIFPHTNSLGSYDSGTFGDGGASRGACTRIFVGMATDREGYEEYDPDSGSGFQPDSADHCVNVSWPAQYLWRTHQTRQEKAPWSWNGSLIQNKRDASGQLYMRNRFYDPGTGRFTQEDPIGIAGGMNVYGFANGDPVNYSDPYGLTSCRNDDRLCQWARAGWTLLGGIAGGVGGGAAGFGAGLLCGPGAGACSTYGAVALGSAGSLAGAKTAQDWFDNSFASERAEPSRGRSGNGSRERSIRSLERQIEDHQDKLEAYKRDPDAFDNLGYLRNAPNEAVRQRIISGRIRHLETEIRTFQRQLSELRGQ